MDLDNADYLSTFDEFSDGVRVTDSKGVIVYYNQSLSYIYELHQDNTKQVLLFSLRVMQKQTILESISG